MRSDASANKVTLLSGFCCMRALSDLHETIPPYNKNCRTSTSLFALISEDSKGKTQ